MIAENHARRHFHTSTVLVAVLFKFSHLNAVILRDQQERWRRSLGWQRPRALLIAQILCVFNKDIEQCKILMSKQIGVNMDWGGWTLPLALTTSFSDFNSTYQ